MPLSIELQPERFPWLHSVTHEVEFVSPWAALQQAEELAFDVGYTNAIRIDLCQLPKPKRSAAKLSFDPMVQVRILDDCTFLERTQEAFEDTLPCWPSKPWSLADPRTFDYDYCVDIAACSDQLSFMQVALRRELPPEAWMQVPGHPTEARAHRALAPVPADNLGQHDPHDAEIDAHDFNDASSTSSHTMQSVFLYHLDDPVIHGRIDWTDFDDMMHDAARLLQVDRDHLVALHEISVPLDDVPGETVPLIAQLDDDLEAGEPSRLCLVDYEIHGHAVEAHHRTASVVERQVLITPTPATIQAIFQRAGIDVYCAIEDNRCVMFHNHRPVLSQRAPIFPVAHGDFLRLVIPPSMTCPEPTQLLLLRRQATLDEPIDSDPSASPGSGYSPSLVPSEEIRQQFGQVDTDDLPLLQIRSMPCRAVVELPSKNGCLASLPASSRSPDAAPRPLGCSFTDEFLAAIRARQQAEEPLPDFDDPRPDIEFMPRFIQNLFAQWTQSASVGPGGMEMLGRVETWYSDHWRQQTCYHPRQVVLSRDYHNWEGQLKAAWYDRVLNTLPVEFYLVHPLPEDAAPNVFAQVILVQQPDPRQRSVILTITDSHHDDGRPHSKAIVTLDQVRRDNILFAGLMHDDCAPDSSVAHCTTWFGDFELVGDALLRVRHGFTFQLRILRGLAPIVQGLRQLDDDQLRHRLADLVAPSHLADDSDPSDAPLHLPDWINALQVAFDNFAAIELEEEGQVEYVQTWFLNGRHFTHCVVPRTVRIRAHFSAWTRIILDAWQDCTDSRLIPYLYFVDPRPPMMPTQSYIGHVIVVQDPVPDRVPILLTCRLPHHDHEILQHAAIAVPEIMSSQQIIDLVQATRHFHHGSWQVRRGTLLFSRAGGSRVGHGDSLIVEPTHGALAPSLHQPIDGETTSFLQYPRKLTRATSVSEVPHPDSDAQHCWERLTTDVVAQAQWPQEVPPSHRSVPPHRISLDALITQEVPSIDVPCDEIQQLAQQMFLLDLGPNLPFASVVKWHDSTLAARSACPDWHGSPPLRFWFYTDGASCYASDAGRRFASAAVVLLIETADGMHFGGFRPFLVPIPATAPFAEHVAMLIAHLWCLQMHEWCLTMYGYWSIPVTFAFDCLAAGHAALGTWTCPQHQSVHRLTQSLTYWMQVRYACQHSYIHVRSHQGDAWNEAADAVCWAALHGWISAPDFAALFSQHLESHLCAAEWLGYCHYASIGAIGYPSIKNAFFVYHLPLDAPAPDASGHTLVARDSEALDAPVENTEVLLRCSTANVLTLYTTQHANGGFMSARHEALMNSFHQLGVHVVGVQETRSKLQGHHAAEHFHVLSASALRSGHCGVQLWVAKKIQVRDGHLVVCASHLRVLHQSARRLIARLAVDGLRIVFIVGHVPCADESAAQSWWTDTSALIPESYRSWPCIMLVDANGKVGSLTSTAIGDHHPCDENTHGALMHQWLVDHHMFAPQTFVDHHSGPSATFAHSKGPESRIDYVLVDERLRCPTLTSRVLDLDLAIHRPDHYAVSVDVPVTIWKCRRDHMTQRKKSLHQQVPSLVSPPSVDWNLDVHTHAALLHRWLHQHQPARPRFPRKRHLRLSTWQLIQEKSGHWKRLRQITTTMRSATLRCLFSAWRATCSSSWVAMPSCHDWLRLCHHGLSWHLFHHRRLGCLVSVPVREDDAQFYQALAERHSDESLPTLWKSLKPLLPRQAAKRRNNIRCVGPATCDIVSHFDALEAGEVVSYPQLLSDCHQRQQSCLHDAPVVVPLHALPSNVDIAQLCRRTKQGKAPGLDEVTATTLQHCLLSFAASAHLLFLKAFLLGAEPLQLQWKGGKVHVIPKKTNLLRADAMRGIMFLTGLGKMYD